MPNPNTRVSDGGGSELYDIAVIGGGINGCGIARDAAGRGLKVFLCEQGDLGGGTSSTSSQLIHGGLRYLEQYEFKLVRESLRERETLLKSAPHLIAPMRFVLPHRRGLRPVWMIRLGLWLYDLLGGKRSLSRSKWINLARHPAGAALKSEFTSGFEYADCHTDDARLVVTVAKDARRLGAVIETRTHCDSVARSDSSGLWEIALNDAHGATTSVRAKALVNATGPWVARFTAANAQALRSAGEHQVKLVQGSHIVVKKWFAGEHAYMLQNDDQRVVFVIPFQHDLAIIGATEVDYHGDPAEARITRAETDYLCALVNRYFRVSLTPGDVIWSYSGVRPLYDDGADSLSEVTRDYVISLDPADTSPVITIYGGKLTTFRCLAEATLDKLAPYFPAIKPAWTADAVLPGGNIKAPTLSETHPFLPEALSARYGSAYGNDASDMLGNAGSIEDLGKHFGHDLYQIEVAYLIEHEWARNAGDILWRRSKLGLRFDTHEVAALEGWLAAQFGCVDAGANETDSRQPVVDGVID